MPKGLELLAGNSAIWIVPLAVLLVFLALGALYESLPLPLATSTGAGSEMRNAMAIAVMAGMIGVTTFGIFLPPVFYVVLRAGHRKGMPITEKGHSCHRGAAACRRKS